MNKPQSSQAFDRRGFISTLAGSAAMIGFSSFLLPEEIKFYESYGPDDLNSWSARIKGKHKMAFDATKPHGIYPFAWPRVFYLTNQATGSAPKDCCAVVVLRHSAIPYAFDHAVWEKYNLGEVFGAPDPKTLEPSKRNPFWQPAKGDFMVPGIGEVTIGINDLQETGAMLAVCSAAIKVFSTAVAEKMNLSQEEVSKEWMEALIPGIQPVPSGIWALGRAQEKGCGYVFTG